MSKKRTLDKELVDCDYLDASVEVRMPDGSWKRVPVSITPKAIAGLIDEVRIITKKKREQ